MNMKGLGLHRAVVTAGSLNEAADRMNLSPSAARRLLSRLESNLRLTLFARSRRNLSQTEEGTQFQRQISNMLDGIDEIPPIARDLRSRTRNLPATCRGRAHRSEVFRKSPD